MIRQSEVFPFYRECCDCYEKAWDTILKISNVEQNVDELCTIRGYIKGDVQSKLLNEIGVGFCSIVDVSILGEKASDFGLVTVAGDFLLNNRYIIPVRDINSKIVAMIGYFNDYKKYITTPSPYFSKKINFLNIDNAFKLSWTEFDGLVFLVEGVFDCWSLRSVGLPAIATMGSSVSAYKREILSLFKKVVYIPDNDVVGRRALYRHSKYGWSVPETALGLRLTGSLDLNEAGEQDANKIHKVKDVDNLVSWFDADDVKNILLELSESKGDMEWLRV